MNGWTCGRVFALAMASLILAACAAQEPKGGVNSAAVGSPAEHKAPPVEAVVAQPAVAAVAAPIARIELPPPSAIETQYGIQIAHISVTAAGGLVDVRFKVLDAVKARELLGNVAHAPMLIAGDQPPLMPPHHALRGARFGQGQVFYILYPNLRRAVQPGAEVTVAVGDVHLGPVIAQ